MERVRRALPTALVLAVLAATAIAFAVTERLKLEPPPIAGPRVTEAFSPVCRCPTRVAHVEFRLRRPERVTVTIIDEAGDAVGMIADRERYDARRVRLTWAGGAAPEGTYRARLQLHDARRTIVIPNRIRLDRTPPVLSVSAIGPLVFSPDGDGRADKVRATYSVSERSTVVMAVDGERAAVARPRTRGGVDWYGRRGGQRLRPGLYAVSLVAVDAAGNRSQPSPTAVVRLRFIELITRRMRVRAGARFRVRVSTDAERYRWRLGRRRGVGRSPVLVLRAPRQPGRYTLRVTLGRHRAAAAIFVRSAGR